jgi:hypothetical protein
MFHDVYKLPGDVNVFQPKERNTEIIIHTS